MKNIKKYILGFLATLMLCITSVVSINNTQNDIVVNAADEVVPELAPISVLTESTYNDKPLYDRTDNVQSYSKRIINNYKSIKEIYFSPNININYFYDNQFYFSNDVNIEISSVNSPGISINIIGTAHSGTDFKIIYHDFVNSTSNITLFVSRGYTGTDIDFYGFNPDFDYSKPLVTFDDDDLGFVYPFVMENDIPNISQLSLNRVLGCSPFYTNIYNSSDIVNYYSWDKDYFPYSDAYSSLDSSLNYETNAYVIDHIYFNEDDMNFLILLYDLMAKIEDVLMNIESRKYIIDNYDLLYLYACYDSGVLPITSAYLVKPGYDNLLAATTYDFVFDFNSGGIGYYRYSLQSPTDNGFKLLWQATEETDSTGILVKVEENYTEYEELFLNNDSPIYLFPSFMASLTGTYMNVYNHYFTPLISAKPYEKVHEGQGVIAGLFSALITGINGIISPIIEGIKNGFNDLFVDDYLITNPILNNEKLVLNYDVPNTNYKTFYINTEEWSDLINSGIVPLQDYNDIPLALYEDSSMNKYYNVKDSYLLYCFRKDNLNVGYPNTIGYFYIFLDVHGIRICNYESTSYFFQNNKYINPVKLDNYLSLLNTANTYILDEVNGYEVGDYNDKITDLVAINENVNAQRLTSIAYFLIGMFGLSIGIGLVWLVISIMKNRK